ncbi:hypothetical protein [Streptomyces sp. SID12501]|uniref:Uncharacterized protein n=1 Tax=Streptomyces sp. SID12501 TaxID=2706042 RepID=A0A6B3BTI5_9ACTN|nr:hypothetical protein [Streptomyces sp. SID12501]NEC87610.1 hypothetical protein [Streptomyces sp. SID12501]
MGSNERRPWEADFGAGFSRRLGQSPQELGLTSATESCPDIWELENGDFAFIGREATDSYADRLPAGVSVAHDERVVIVPRKTLLSAKRDIPDA